MTLLYLDGFAHQNNARYVSAAGQWHTVGGRVQPYWVTGSQFMRTFTPSAEVISGFGCLAGINNGQIIATVWTDGGASQQLTIAADTNNRINVYRGGYGGTLLGTTTFAYDTSTWFYIELRVVIHSTAGVLKVRINGATTDDISFTGNTRAGGTSTNVDAITLCNGNSTVFVTDWYICNTLGSVNNTWLGDTVVYSLAPNADGTLSGLTGSDGNQVANWQQVDEIPASTTDYNGSPTSNVEDTYNLTDLAGTVRSVNGVAVNALMAKSDASAAAASIVARTGGTDYTSGSRSLTTSYVEYTDLWEQNPATGQPWTPTEVNALQAGMKVT